MDFSVKGMDRRMGKNNKGLSLVEIIIVVAIMSAMIGITGYGISMISGKPAEECAQKLCSAIQHARTMTMGKSKTSMILRRDSNGMVSVKEVSEKLLDNDGNLEIEEREIIVGEKAVTVTCYMTDGSSIEIAGSNTLEIVFDRGSGAIRTTKVNGTDSVPCTKITVAKANKSKDIVIVPVTGKVSIANTP